MYHLTDPLPHTGIRALLCISGRDHHQARLQRHTAAAERSASANGRTARMLREAIQADARAWELLQECR